MNSTLCSAPVFLNYSSLSKQICALILVALGWSLYPAHSQSPEWIWFEKTNGQETRYFRKTFDAPPNISRADLVATGDDSVEVFLNGERVTRTATWSEPGRARVESRLKTGTNTLALRATNGDSSAAAVLLQLELKTSTASIFVITDATWRANSTDSGGWQQPGFDDSSWAQAKTLGKHGVDPWGEVLHKRRQATSPEDLHSLPGFKVELILNADDGEGSWVALAKDNKGRLIISPQHAKGAEGQGGLLRVTLDAQGKPTKRDFIAKPIFDAQGMHFSNDTLYVVVNKYSSSFESGLYKVRDVNGTDTFDEIKLLKYIKGGGEHGPHAVELGPDGKLYVVGGNHTQLPDNVSPDSPFKNYQEDHLLPRQWDGNGHAAGILAPGGWIARTDLEGKSWDIFSAGFRNQYDITFNVDGELFTYDSDMEWDWGMPWYRPTRVNHCVSGAEFGWRSGTGKWPDYYPDSLPAIDIGIGCPTGVGNGIGSHFPAKYQRAIYIMDWTYGRLMALHLNPNGASYSGTFENFVCPKGLVDPKSQKRPLNVTDMVVGKDGAMYFTVGGRGVQSGLYRVSYVGSESTAKADQPNTEGAAARALRKKLEVFHGKTDPTAIETLWPHLNNPDRFIRYAARTGLEFQPVLGWKDKALQESAVDGALAALMALARIGGKETQPELLKALTKFPLNALSESQQLDKLRIIAVSFARYGRPNQELVNHAITKLSARFPSSSNRLNRELSQLLIYLEAPGSIENVLKLMRESNVQEDVLHYLFHARSAKNWTTDQRKEYFSYFAKDWSGYQHPSQTLQWFKEAGRDYGNGASFANFLKNFYNEAVQNIPTQQKISLEPLLAEVNPSQSGGPNRRGNQTFPPPRQRQMVKEWVFADLAGQVESTFKGRNFERGRQAFVDAQCLACHRFGNEGGGVGPDLTAISTRFSRRDIFDSIINPSKVVSEQYQNTMIETRGGDDFSGRLISETETELVLLPDQLKPDSRIIVKKSEIKTRQPSKVSPMPDGLINILSKDDILDMLAFLEAAGRRDHSAFKP